MDDKQPVVFLANRLAIAGFGVLALAMTGVVLLVTGFLFGRLTRRSRRPSPR